MNTKIIVSVIIPTYNVDEYIEACVTSIQKQKIDHLEVIIVDDCSRDNTIAILHKLGKIYSNLSLFLKTQNTGVSDSRNLGIKRASGKYIFFCDADDELPPKALSRLIRKAEKTEADLITGRFVRIYSDGREEIEKLDYSSDFDRALRMAVIWNKLFRSDFLINHQIQFAPNTKYGEDTLFIAEIMRLEPRLAFVNRCVYRHLEMRNKNADSQLTMEYSAVRFNQYANLYSNIFLYTSFDDHKKEWHNFYIASIGYLFRIIWAGLNNIEDKEIAFNQLQEIMILCHKQNDVCKFEGDYEYGFIDVFGMTFSMFCSQTFNDYLSFLNSNASGASQRMTISLDVSPEILFSTIVSLYRLKRIGLRSLIRCTFECMKIRIARVFLQNSD